MSLNTIIQYFIPKDTKFYPLFEEATANMVKISEELVEAFSTPDRAKRTQHIHQIEKLEHVGDEITHRIYNETSSTFITPFDREDIQKLASIMDDVLDYIHGAAKRVELYNVDEILPSMLKLAELLVLCTKELEIAVNGLRSRRQYHKVREALIKIHGLETRADDIFDSAIAKLFDDNTSAIEVIKIKEVLSALETATDKCEVVANIIESVIVKFA